jgi:glutamate synthase domain-containing protein 3
LSDLDYDDVELLRKLVREHEEKTVSARARNILVRWDEYVPRFRKITPKGAAVQVAAIRVAYLSAPLADAEAVLARRTA